MRIRIAGHPVAFYDMNWLFNPWAKVKSVRMKIDIISYVKGMM